MSMKGKSMLTGRNILIIAVVLVVGLQVTGLYDFTQLVSTTGASITGGVSDTTTVVTGGGSGFATTISASGFDKQAGALTNVNAEVWEVRADGSEVQLVGETQANAVLTDLSTTAPNSLNGFIIIGNDDLVSGTDRGTEYYYSRNPIAYQDRSGSTPFDRLPTPAEGTLTLTGYDDGTSETTLNITVGAGGRVTTTEVRFEVSADGTFGNPQVERPIAVCFNETTSGLFDEIKPANFESTMPVPGFLSSFNYIEPCYVLPINSLQEGVSGEASTYRFFIIIDADGTQNPGNTDNTHILILDSTYSQNDDLDWRTGFEDSTEVGTDTDVGSDNLAGAFIVMNYG